MRMIGREDSTRKGWAKNQRSTTNAHDISHCQDSFVGAFARIDPGYTILWRMEMEIEEAKGISHLHLLKWLPQRDLMSKIF